MLNILKLTTENLTKECVTDNKHPRFSFTLASDRDEVFLDKAVISVNGWSFETSEQISVPYNGEELKPYTQYLVTVEATDNYGDTAEASMIFQTGRLDVEWKAKWITDTSYHFTGKRISPKTMTFQKKISVNKKIQSAKIYATAIGIYELLLNGNKVGTDYFMPGYTSYQHQLQYQTYDITDMILENENTLVAVVGGGWAVGAFSFRRINRITAKRQAFLGEIRILYQDGTQETIRTDESWKVTENGNYQMTEFYNGESYDASIDLKQTDWVQAGVESVKIHPKIIAHYGAPVRAHEIMMPCSIMRAKGGNIIYDFGQNFAGVIHATLNGNKGQVVVFHHSEILVDGELYTKPLRTACATATYTCVDGRQTYSPRMTYMGFRYVSITGIEEKDIELKALELYSDMEQYGTFECSNEMINQLQSNICWSAKSNFVDIPTDCPQRDERMGWTGDIALFSRTAYYNFNMSRFIEKWLLDVKAEQRAGGGIPGTVPHVVIPMQIESRFPMAIDHWGDACILVPWADYMSRGDKETLRLMYPTMKKYLKACKFWAEALSLGENRRIWKLIFHYGDWCAPDTEYKGWKSRGKWTATACLANSSRIVAQIAEILGEIDDSNYYTKLYEETAKAYIVVFTDGKGKLKKEFQTAYVLPLYYDIFQKSDKQRAAENLVRLVRKNDYHIGTGFPGTPYILFALADNGYVDDAYKMLLEDSCPSWLYEVKVGATTIWERWDGLNEDGCCMKNDMVSFNHYASGAVGDFLYRRIAGIEATEGGYKKFRIAPFVGGNISYARGSVETPYGRIESEWQINNNQFLIRVVIPVGTVCTLKLPDGETKVLSSGTYHNQCIAINAESVLRTKK